MILHHTADEVKRFNWFKWLVLLLLFIIFIILLLSGNPGEETAVSDTPAADTTEQVEESMPELAVPILNTPDGNLTGGAVALSGTGEPGSEVEVLIDGAVIGTTTVGADGTWSLDTDLDAGEYTFSARTLDADGNVAAEADGITLSIGEALAAPSIDLPDAALSAGPVSLTGTGTPGSEVDVMVDGVSVGRTTVGADGIWLLDTELADGDFELSAQASSGDETAVSDPIALTVSPRFSPPTFTIPDGEVPTGTITLVGDGDPGATIDLVLNGEVVDTITVGDDGTWSYDLDLPEGGDFELRARTLDADGAVVAESNPATMNVVAPEIPMPTMDIPEGGFPSGSFTLTGTGMPGSEVEIVVDGEVLGTTTVGDDGTWSFDLDLPAGEYELVVNALDANGQVIASSDSALISLNPAESGAELAITEPADGATLQSGELVLAGTGEPGSEIEFLDNGVVIGTAVVSDDGSWTYTFTPESGNHEYSVRAIGAETAAASVMTTIEAPVTDTSAVGICENPQPGIDQGSTYIVGECEWLIRIAGNLGVDYDAVVALNPQIENPNIIYVGQVINLPPR